MWTQQDLAHKMGTTQAAISRMEDPSYGRLSIKTLTELCRVFDVGLQVRFVSTITMLANTFRPNAADRLVPEFNEEADDVDFFDESLHTTGIHHGVSLQIPLGIFANTLRSNAADKLAPRFNEEAYDVDFFDESLNTVSINQITPTRTVSLAEASLPKRSLNFDTHSQSAVVTSPIHVSISEQFL